MPQQTSLSTVDALVSQGFLSQDAAEKLTNIEARYAVAVPGHLAGLIDHADPDDPIARQVLPSADELVTRPEDLSDPIGDDVHSPAKGLVHRYPDRVLLKLHSACAVYCRFCFRREVVGPGGDTMSKDDLEAAYDYIANDKNIWEVILTGGDPLVLGPQRLNDVLDSLDDIYHVAVVRLHTRVPIATPEHISKQLIDVLSKRRATLYIAIHTNHAKELTDDVFSVCQRLTEAGIPLLGQTVLLKGVNDNTETLEALFRKMVTARITPYYLHHPDLAPGTGHFRISIERGQALVKTLRGRLSGIALPTYILDIPGGFGKVPIGPSYMKSRSENALVIKDVQGRHHLYPPSSSTSKA